MGRTSLVEHTIDTGDHRPIHHGFWRQPLTQIEGIDRQVDTLVANDFVELDASPWASNVALLRKKYGSHKLCADYRKVNDITRKDSYPFLTLTCI